MKNLSDFFGKKWFVFAILCCLIFLLVIELSLTLPWWRNWWGYLLNGLLLLTFVYVVRRYELNRFRRNNQLKQEMAEADAIHKMDQMRSQLIADISHEFRRPLSQIISQLENVIQSGIKDRERLKLEVANNNAQKLLTQIDYILDPALMKSDVIEFDSAHALEERGSSKDACAELAEVHDIIPTLFFGTGEDESGQRYTSSPSFDRRREIVLVMENNFDVRTYIRKQMEDDYEVMEADNGGEGLSIAQKTIPDLIICDLLMLQMNGYSLCQELRKDERTNHIPVIMLTPKTGFDNRTKGLETCADASITKPFSAKELKVRVRKLLDHRSLLRSHFSLVTMTRPSEVPAKSIGQAFLEKAIGIIETNIENPEFTIEMLSKEVNMSVSQLNRKLNALIDQPAGHLIRSLRLHRAADLLENKEGTVAQVGYKLGFNDQAYFSRAFKKQFGCTPSEYMNG